MARSTKKVIAGCVASVVLLCGGASSGGLAFGPIFPDSVVKIHVTTQKDDYALPWQSQRPFGATGSGFIIKGRRLLTNAHIVSNARFLQVQKNGDAQRYDARVAFVGTDCDLAILTVEDEEFFTGTRALEIARNLPGLDDEVTVVGYPMGGDRLSLTRGVVSRIDYSVYTHSGADQHLVLQVDAAINPGNSGGPVLFGGRVVGLAFQGLAWADNIGYAIPIPVIRHFLVDIADGVYHGYPELGVSYLGLRNVALRADLGVSPSESGVVVSYVDPYGSGNGMLRPRDVLLSIDGKRIQDDGTVELDGNRVVFAEILERKQHGESVCFRVLRDGLPVTVTVGLAVPADPFTFRNIYDQRPRYLIHAGLVFSPLNREYLRTLGGDFSDANRQQLLYCSEYAKIDGMHEDRREFVVLIRVLPHPVNTYAGKFLNAIVDEVNGQHISCLKDVRRALAQPRDGFHVLRFVGMSESLVLKTGEALTAGDEILRAYRVPASEYLDE